MTYVSADFGYGFLLTFAIVMIVIASLSVVLLSSLGALKKN